AHRFDGGLVQDRMAGRACDADRAGAAVAPHDETDAHLASQALAACVGRIAQRPAEFPGDDTRIVRNCRISRFAGSFGRSAFSRAALGVRLGGSTTASLFAYLFPRPLSF